MKGLVVALQFLTRLPTPRIAVSSDEFAASMRWFPAAGAIIAPTPRVAAAVAASAAKRRTGRSISSSFMGVVGWSLCLVTG